MHTDFNKICRVCMASGSRNLFKNVKNLQIPSASEEIAAHHPSPLDRLVEKLRYITMLKIEENDNLPNLLCDLCIVQLNVAYNFKRLAIENDTKLNQYIIEKGIVKNPTISSHTENSINNTAATTNRHNFPIIPIIVKTEPVDVDTLSDDTNITNSTVTNNNDGQQSIIPIHSFDEQNLTNDNNRLFNMTPQTNNSMVLVNSYIYSRLTPSSDIEFTQNFNLSRNHNSNDTTIDKNLTNEDENHMEIETINDSKEAIKKNINMNIRKLNKKPRSHRELKGLSISMQLPIGKLPREVMKKSIDFRRKIKIENFNDNIYDTSINPLKKAKENCKNKYNNKSYNLRKKIMLKKQKRKLHLEQKMKKDEKMKKKIFNNKKTKKHDNLEVRQPKKNRKINNDNKQFEN